MYLVSSNPHMLQMFRELASQRDMFKQLGWDAAPGGAPANIVQALADCTATGSERLTDDGEALRRVMLTAKGTMVLKAHLQDA